MKIVEPFAAAAALSALLWVLLFAPGTHADERAWAALQRGTHVILVRHAVTTPGVGDPPGFKLDDCATQRNLSDEGRTQARQLGETFRRRRIDVDRLVASPWCRCIETARLAFNRAPETSVALSNLFGQPKNRDKQVGELSKLVGDYRGPGNLVLVTHGSTISALTGISPAMGEIVVVKPDGGGKFSIVGRAGIE